MPQKKSKIKKPVNNWQVGGYVPLGSGILEQLPPSYSTEWKANQTIVINNGSKNNT